MYQPHFTPLAFTVNFVQSVEKESSSIVTREKKKYWSEIRLNYGGATYQLVTAGGSFKRFYLFILF